MAVAARLREVRGRVDAAAKRAGRDPHDVLLMPISKYHPDAAVQECIDAGYRTFGENRLQDLRDRALALPDARFVMTGNVQSNKAKMVVDYAAELHSLDSLKLAANLDKRLADAGRKLPVLVQVNTSGEPQKSGIQPSEAVQFARNLIEFKNLDVQGLMTMAMHTDDETAIAGCFESLRDVQAHLREEVPELSWRELSMGMSNDFELAIAHGATIVRVGTAIFGPRPYA